MSCEQTTGLLSDRLKGPLPAEAEHRLHSHLAVCPACREEAEAFSMLWDEMGGLDDAVPHERMRARFHAALAAYEQGRRSTGLDRLIESFWPQKPALQAGLAASLLVVGLMAGVSLSLLSSSTDRQLAELRGEIRAVGVALLGHQSASERLRGIEWSRRVDWDAFVADALLETLRHDPNTNVRLAAVDALGRWTDRPQIGAALSDALERQDAPLVQVTLAQILLERNVSSSAAAVRRMLQREELDPLVREHLRAVLARIDSGEDGGETPLPAVEEV